MTTIPSDVRLDFFAPVQCGANGNGQLGFTVRFTEQFATQLANLFAGFKVIRRLTISVLRMWIGLLSGAERLNEFR